LCRRLGEEQLKNAILQDPAIRSQKYNLRTSTTAGTSGHFLHKSHGVKSQPLLSCIRIISEAELKGTTTKPIGSGRFGTCYSKSFSHFQVCVKVISALDRSSFIKEANITSKFSHAHLPFLFGVSISSQSVSLVLSYHSIGKHVVTLRCALETSSKELTAAVGEIEWLNILRGVIHGLDYLHSNYKVIHNDIKGDNIVLDMKESSIEGIIIDFGKACSISEGEYYTLSETKKEKYKRYHPHISPDLRDGVSKQSVLSDVYSYGRIVSAVNESKVKDEHLTQLSKNCLRYNSSERPSTKMIKTYFHT